MCFSSFPISFFSCVTSLPSFPSAAYMLSFLPCFLFVLLPSYLFFHLLLICFSSFLIYLFLFCVSFLPPFSSTVPHPPSFCSFVIPLRSTLSASPHPPYSSLLHFSFPCYFPTSFVIHLLVFILLILPVFLLSLFPFILLYFIFASFSLCSSSSSFTSPFAFVCPY